MKMLNKLNLFMRSLIFSIISLTIIFFYSFISILLWPFPLRVRYAFIMSYTRFAIYLLKVICHIDYQIVGLENIPKNRNGIVLSKHQSTWETFFLPTIFSQAAIILKRELLWVPFFGWGLATLAPIAINRNQSTTAMDQIIKQGKKYLDSGRWVLIFPEGTRIPPGKIGKFRLGGARLAIATGYPIIPVAVNAGRCWPKQQFIKKPGLVTVAIGPLIETKGKTAEEVMLQAKKWIEDKMNQID